MYAKDIAFGSWRSQNEGKMKTKGMDVLCLHFHHADKLKWDGCLNYYNLLFKSFSMVYNVDIGKQKAMASKISIMWRGAY